MNVKKLLTAVLVAATLIATRASAAPAPYPAPADERSQREAELYEDGTDSIDEEQWENALNKFARVVEMKGSRADGAIFWSAYALKKLGRNAEALKALDGLRKAYPASRWIDDARALELELRHSRGERVAPERVEDEDVKMIAINSLMHTNPEKAFPLLEKIVRNGNSSRKVRERALFVLSQSSSPRAQTLLADIARDAGDAGLQKAAVRYLGISGNAHNRQALADLYASAASTAVKKEVLRALMVSGDKGRVLAAARSERDAGLRSEAIRTLGVMGARGELASLYAAETSASVREDIIEALFISGDTERIGQLARTETDPSLRKEAIQKLGLMGGKTAPALAALYAAEANVDVKEAIIQAYFLQSNARALVDLARRETNKRLRTAAVKKLSLMGDEEAVAYMLQILNQ
jgi:hypothetical protein